MASNEMAGLANFYNAIPAAMHYHCLRTKTSSTGWLLKNGPPFYIGFQLILIVLANSDEQMPYWLGFGDSFAVFYIAVTCLVQELC